MDEQLEQQLNEILLSDQYKHLAQRDIPNFAQAATVAFTAWMTTYNLLKNSQSGTSISKSDRLNVLLHAWDVSFIVYYNEHAGTNARLDKGQ